MTNRGVYGFLILNGGDQIFDNIVFFVFDMICLSRKLSFFVVLFHRDFWFCDKLMCKGHEVPGRCRGDRHDAQQPRQPAKLWFRRIFCFFFKHMISLHYLVF